MKLGRNIAITVVCIILGMIITWQYKSISYNQAVSSLENKRAEELMSDLLNEKKNNENLRKKYEELDQDYRKILDTRGQADETAKALGKEIEKTRLIAGLTDVKGRGIIITLDNNGFSHVIESDILNILNELKASDAQAISVNDERIVAMSEVREAGRFIMINGKQMLPPFVIKAIADPDKLENSVKIMGGVVERLGDYLKVKIEKSDNIAIPKIKDDGFVLRYNLLTPVNPK